MDLDIYIYIHIYIYIYVYLSLSLYLFICSSIYCSSYLLMLDLGWLAAVMRVLCAKSRPNFWLISSVSLVKASCESFPCRGIQSAKGTLVTGSEEST